MKGFKKDGKFRPTGTKTKSSLRKSDVKRKSIVRNKESIKEQKEREEPPMKIYRVKFVANFLVEAEDEDEAYNEFEEQLDLSQVKITESKDKIE